MQIQRPSVHRQLPVRRSRPQLLWPVAIQFHAVLIRIAQVNRFAHAMVRCPIQRDPRVKHPAQSFRQCSTRGIDNRRVIQPCSSRRRRRAAQALPSIHSQMMVITGRRKKRRALPKPLRHLKSQNPAIKVQRPRNIRHPQMYMPNVHARINHICRPRAFTVLRYRHSLSLTRLPQTLLATISSPPARPSQTAGNNRNSSAKQSSLRET